MSTNRETAERIVSTYFEAGADRGQCKQAIEQVLESARRPAPAASAWQASPPLVGVDGCPSCPADPGAPHRSGCPEAPLLPEDVRAAIEQAESHPCALPSLTKQRTCLDVAHIPGVVLCPPCFAKVLARYVQSLGGGQR